LGASSAKDACDLSLSGLTIDNGTGTDCSKTYTVSATDCSERTGTQTVAVKILTADPTITVASSLASCFKSTADAKTAIENASSAADACNTALTPTVSNGTAVDPCNVKFTVSATDCSGRTKTKDVTVTVVTD